MKREYKARLKIEEKDDRIRLQELLDMMSLAIEISNMDKEKASEYQKKKLENI